MLTKGASEMVMRSCNKYHNSNTGQITSMDAAMVTTVEENIKKMADNALRTICLAYREITGSEDLHTKDHLGVFDVETKDLILMGVFGIADVIRPEVPKALQ
jgi:magnesium-transporting ATPase (P-type)